MCEVGSGIVLLMFALLLRGVLYRVLGVWGWRCAGGVAMVALGRGDGSVRGRICVVWNLFVDLVGLWILMVREIWGGF